MPVQHIPQDKNTRSHRDTAVLTFTARVPLNYTPSVHKMSANLDRGKPIEGAAPSRKWGMKSRRSRSFSCLLGGYPGISEGERARLGEVEDEEGKESMEGKDSGNTEVADALANAPKVPQGSNLALSSQPLVSQTEPSLLKMMEEMTQFMGKLTKAVSSRESSKAPEFKTSSMKEPYSFDGTQAHKLKGFIQSFQLIFHKNPENFFSDRKEVLYQTSLHTGRAGKWIEPCLSNISNEDRSYLFNNCKFFEAQLLTLFCDPSEVTKFEQELDNLRMKESGHVSFYIGEKGHKFIFTEEDWHQDYWINTIYHERQKEKGGNQEKNPLVTGSNFSRPPQGSSSKRNHHRKNKKGKKSQVSKDKHHAALLNKDNKFIGSEKEWMIKQGLCTYCGGKSPIEEFSKRPQNKPGSSRGFPSKKGKA
ncbi:hypothetical protein O181_010252 [Austropuccinia psidii MF-1]|uniref:Retrotransposon gag domain-containing protein n=1 Tax=Austropuccinia psidii MF-1 TaxID=1389203 RepID=A0A9Q3BTC6_9BASI|nr:hypothetical protein [Austropuccinia psidii MF-1]